MKTEQLLIALSVLVAALFFLSTPLSRPWTIANHPGYSMYTMMSGGMFFGMSLIWILVVIFLLLGIFWFLQQLNHNTQQRRRQR